MIIVLGLVLGGYYYYHTRAASNTAQTTLYSVVQQVETGDVSSGIQTTGQIIAEQKLNLDIYKQNYRIAAVNVVNGNHVTQGATMISFDKRDALASNQSAKVALTQAELNLKNTQTNVSDPNAQIRTTQVQIDGYKKTIANNEQAIKDAFTAFLNQNLEVVPDPSQTDRLLVSNAPTVSGKYVGTAEGEYDIRIYSSNAISGFSFEVTGLEQSSGQIVFGKAVDIGTLGLKLTFTNAIANADKWVLKVPNTGTALYQQNMTAYEQQISDLENQITTTETSLANAELSLKNLQQTDTSSFRDLSVEQAQATVASQQQQLSRTSDVIGERDIVAPFNGTIQGMSNVVVGATPTGGTNDPITLGTLVSDTYLASFTLSGSDVAKLSVGQRVKVTVTSYSNNPVFDATVTQISSLPSSTGVAQYQVLARLNYDSTKATDVILREGMLANIEVVQKESSNVLRIPASAVTYVNNKPTVQIIDSLTDAQKQEAARMGIVRTTTTTPLKSHPVTIELGIQGSYYDEVTNGLSQGDYVLVTTVTPNSSQSVVNVGGFPGGGGNFRRESANGSTSGGNAGNTSGGGTSGSATRNNGG